MLPIDKLKLKDLKNIIPSRLLNIFDECNIETIGDLTEKKLEKVYKNKKLDDHLISFLEQLQNKIKYSPKEIIFALNDEKNIELSEEEIEDLNFIKSFTKMVNEYDRLTSISKNPSPSTIDDWKAIKEKEEDIYIEFKSSLRFCYHQKKVEPKLEIKCVKTISAFLNRNGGRLIIGMDDNGTILGINNDLLTWNRKKNTDKFRLHLTNLITKYIGSYILGLIRVKIIKVNNKKICIIRVQPSREPVFFKSGNREEFIIRSSAESIPLKASDTQKYIQEHWGKGMKQ